MDKVQLQENEELYLEIDDYYGLEYLAPHLMELDASLNELNDLAGWLAVLDETEQEAFDGLLRLEIQRKAESNSGILTMQDLRDLAISAGADCCHVVGATSDAELVRFYAENGFMEELDGLSDGVFEMLDFGKIGKALRTGEDGTFTRNGYVVQHSELVNAPPCAKELPEKPEYLFRLTLGLHPDLEDDRTITLELPASAESLRKAQKQLGADGWEGVMVLDYIHFTEGQKQRAAAVNLEEFLRCRGEKLLSSGREKRLVSDNSVTVRGNEWYDHAEERGGHAVSFVQRFYGLSYPDAVTMLLGGELGTAYPSAGERTEEPVKPFALPPANKDMRRVFAYLIKHRGIARDVVAHFAKAGLLYEDAEYHNAVFVGTDADGVPRHAHKRSANSYGKAFRLNVEGSDPRYSFHYVGTDRSLYVFEAPIDMLSFITLYPENWQRHSYVACCGTSIQPVLQMLEQVPQLDTVLLCLDNDEAGHQASRRMQNQLEVRYSVERLIPENKDWNDDLTLNSENAQGLAMNEMR